MPKVLQIDCTNNSGAVELNLANAPYGGAETDLYIEFDVAFNSTWVTSVLGQSFGQTLLGLTDSSGNDFGLEIDPVSGVLKWTTFMEGAAYPASPYFAPSPAITADQEYHVAAHITAGTPPTVTVTVDGVSIGTITTTGGTLANVKFVDLEAVGLAQAGAFVYFDNFKAGTTLGGSDIAGDTFESGTISASVWNSFISDDAAVIDDPGLTPPVGGSPAGDEGRVLVALSDGPDEANPTWTRIDDMYANFCAGYDIHTGRQTTDEQTDSGEATVYFNDTQGYLDTANVSSPLPNLAGVQILLQAYDPTTTTWESQFRGWVDYQSTDISPSQVVANVKLECVDVFDKLARTEMVPGMFGNTPPAGKEGTIFYEDTAGTVDDRIIQVLGDANVAYPDRAVVFEGNVSLQESLYDAGDSCLEVLRDCADAEIPLIANQYVDRFGRYVFHGRLSRFDPETVEATTTPDRWTFTRWKAGDGAAILGDPTIAQIRVLGYSEGRRDVINAALCWPQGMPQQQIPDNIYADTASRDAYGYHSLPPVEDLQINEGVTTGLTGKQECAKYAELLVKNMKDPIRRVTGLIVKALNPGDARAAATWPLMTRADISDVIELTVEYPGGTGFVSKSYYVEGYTKRLRPLNPDYDYLEVEFDITPEEWSTDSHGVFA